MDQHQRSPRTTPNRLSPVVELRQYTLHPGKRDALIDVFERHLVESQEETGMNIIGQFRDLDRPDHFVWMRGFDDMEARRQALETFYNGPVWHAHRDAANATMIDSDDVLTAAPRPAGCCLRSGRFITRSTGCLVRNAFAGPLGAARQHLSRHAR